MARRPRLVIPSLPHHITQRGNNRQAIFFSDQDRLDYLKMLHSHSSRHHLRILGWCLMTNHIHLIAVPEKPNSLSLTLGQTHAQYSLQLNRRQSRIGHLWQSRFFSCPLESTHLLAALQYVDVNPVRAGLVPNAGDWPWSSARAHTDPHASDTVLDPAWSRLVEEIGIGSWNHAEWKTSLARGRATNEAGQIRRATKVGEPFGSEAFVAGLEKTSGRRLRILTPGRPPSKIPSDPPAFPPKQTLQIASPTAQSNESNTTKKHRATCSHQYLQEGC